MIALLLRSVDWFIPERLRHSKSDLGRARTFVFTHLLGPTSGASIVAFLFMADPTPGIHVALIAAAIASFWTLPFFLRRTGNLPLVAIASVEILISVTLFGAYNYGGVSSPFLPWLLIALANGFFYLSERPLSVLATFALNLSAFIIVWLTVGKLPVRVPMEQLSAVGFVSAASATLYMAWVAIYYGLLLTSESALEREAQQYRRNLAEARDNAEKASRDKSIFLAKMSHELRTPLNAVIGYSEILQEDADLAADLQRAQDLSRISAAGKHLLSLVTDILDISRIESSELELKTAWFDVGKLIEAAADTARPLVESNGNTLVVRIDPALGRMHSDELRLRQAVLNLLSNAAKFTSNGAVEVSGRRTRGESGDGVEIEVRDSGIGISPEDLKTLFQDFKQVNSPESRKRKGTGLGLALSQQLCAMMGGRITAQSELGRGARFTIRVPAMASVAGEEDSPCNRNGATMNVAAATGQ